MLYLIVAVFIIIFFIYRRYYPVLGVRRFNMGDLELEKINLIDLRDYNESYKETIKGSLNIPIAYLNRYVSEIPKSDIFIVVSSSIEKNMGIRFLRKKGFRVIGYTILNGKNEWVREVQNYGLQCTNEK
jgi:rhodanese-related sulfurtransferase